MQEKEKVGKMIIPPNSLKGHESLKRITLATNANVARRWDTMQEIVLSRKSMPKKDKIRDIMLML